MKNLSRRMKRLLAILLVETIVAVNVISGYASESDGVYTISEAEVEAELQESGNEPVVIQEEVSDDSQDFYEESFEEQELQQEDQNASEGEMASDENVASDEQPVAEEPSLPDEENAEQTDGETGATEEAKEETADTCTCEKACSTSEYDAACPVCSTVADLEEGAKEAFLKESCLKYSGQKEEQETVEPEIVNKESNITIKGISIADGTSISGSSEFEIQVADEVTLSEQAPEITGYEFTGKAYVKTNDGDVEASEIKKETIETEKKEDGVVTQIIIETKWSFYDVNGETWTELTEDTTVAFEYKKLEEAVEEDEEAIVVNFYAVCVDEDGNVIDGFEKTELAVSDSLDLTKAPVTIDGYNYVEANIGDATVISLDQSKSTDADGKETTVYSYTTADGKVEVTEDVTVTLSYEMTEEEKTAIHFYAECIDEKGNAIADYEKKTLHFSGSMDLTAEPFAIEEYEYVEAAIDGTVVLSVDKATVEDKDGKETIAYSYTTADGSVEVSEDTTVTLTYKSVKKAAEVTLTWSYVDEEGLTIEGAEGEPKFDDTLVLDDTEKAPVVIEGYEYVEATIDGVVITAITKTVEDADAEAAAEETADAEPVYSYAYTTAAGESVAIEEDTEITLGYEETGIPVKVDATVVDEFGDEIDEKYTNMELPKFTDGELVLNDVENPPVAKVQIRKSLFKVIKYTYVQATIDNKIITGLKREATAATADLKEKEQEYIYSYTTDGENWTKLKEDTTVYFEYTDGRKTVFTYEDSKVLVTATLQHAGAIPDDAEFVVTEITSGQAYDAYIAALNNASDEDKEYSEQNTLLYDMAFVGINDETGNTIEIEPSEGSVKISIVFKQNQLAEELQAVGSEEVEIKHLPINDAIKESAGMTVNAVGITASDVSVENVGRPTVSIEGEVAEFVTSSFTVYSVSSNPPVSVKKVNLNVKDIINKKAGFDCGIIANTYKWNGDTETNMMVGSYYSTAADLGVSASYGNAGGDNYFGDVLVDLLRFHLAPANVYLGIDATQKYESGDFKFENITGTTIHKNYSIDVSSKIASIGSSVNDGISNNDASNLKDERTNLDLTKLEAGTYVVNYDGTGTLFADKLNININSDQNLIINCTSTELNINRFTINNNRPTTFIGSNVADSDVYTTSVIFNCPNATSVNLCEVPGIIIAPNATVNVYGTSAGILVANNVIGRGAEWHYHNHDLPAPGEAELELEIVKSYNKTLVANQFTFTLKDASGKVVGTASNDATGKVRFPKLTYAAEGTYTYTITENIPTDAITNADGTKTSGRINYENSIITAIVNVEKNTALNKFEAVSITYSKVDAKGNPITSNVNTIINEETDKGSLSVTKSVIGTTATEPFYFTVKDSSGNLVSRDGSTVFAINAGSTVTIGELPFGTYTIQETDASGNPVSYTPGTFPYRVSYSSENVEVSATADGSATITNTFVEETSVSVNKEWVDNENHDGLRPSEIQVQLKANNADVSTPVTLNEKNGWSYTWGNLEKNDAQGNAITYAVDEVSVPAGYSKSVSSDGTHYTITNTHENEKVKAKVIKVWNDNENQDGKRPTDLTVELWKNNTKVIETVTLNSTNDWTATIQNLPEYENGSKITYSWVEKDLPEGYSLSEPVVTSTEAEGIITHSTALTNSYTPGKVSAQVKKAWDDAENQDGKRPEAVKVVLRNTKDSAYELEVTLNADNGWTATVNDLPEYTAGVKNEYYWTEDTDGLPDGYSLTETKVDGILTTLTNSYVPKTVNVAVEKIWDDSNNQDGKRPDEITVVLNKNGEEFKRVVLNEANTWKAGFTDLPQYTAGQLNTYEWVEAAEGLPDGYELRSSDATAVTENGVITNVTTLTNSYTPQTVDVSVKKVWKDNENQDGKRPEQLEVTLVKNGLATSQTVILNQDNGWTSGIKNLPKYENGSQIRYTWSEEELPDGYTMTENKTEGTITTITNSYTPGEVSVQIIKAWDDNNNQDNIRPSEITVVLKNRINVSYAKEVTLKASENWSATVSGLPEYTQGAKNQYYWTEESLPSGYELAGTSTNGFITTITNRHTPEKVSATVKKIWDDAENQDGVRPQTITVDLIKKNGTTSTVAGTVTLDQTNDWTATISNLDKFTAGVENEYTWSEHTEGWPEGYRLSSKVTEGSITTLTNSYTPQTVDVSVKKVWNDNENQDGKRPDSIQVVLKKTNESGTEIVRTVILKEDNQWTCEITGLPEYTNQQKNTYTWTEDETGLPEGYTLTNIETVGNLTTITNSYTPGKVSVTIEKKWFDSENQDGIRPEQLEVILLKNGDEYKTVTLTQDNGWRVTVDGLDEFTNKQKNVYTWDEKSVPAGYELTGKVTEGTLTTITNTHTTEKTRVTVHKVWDDEENQDGMRPSQLKVSLLKNGTSIQTVVLTEENNWTYTVTGLDKYSDSGTLVEYRWEENTTEFNGYTLTNTETDDGTATTGRITTLTNTHVPGKIKVSVEKCWDDQDNQDGKRPTELKVDLKKNGTLYTTVTLNAGNGWKATVSDLDEYENGQLLRYTWEEHTGDLPQGYSLVNTTRSEGNAETGVLTTLTNKYEPGKVSVSGEKTWNDADNQDGKRPARITINLLADGVKIDSKTVTAQDGWKWSFTGLDEYKNGKKITYTIEEEPVAEYTSVVDGYNVENTHIPDTINIEGKKTWNDAENKDGIRPESITVTLLADLKPYETRTVTAADNWEWKFTNLPKYKNVDGKVSEIGYTIQETVVVDKNNQTGTYTSTVNGFDIENTHIPETVEVSGTKTWNDNDNVAGNRPETIVIHLWADGKEINKTTVSSADGWKWSFDDLPKYADGKLINYEITEDVIEYYTPKITKTADYTYTVENDYTPEVTTRKVTKIWNDMNNADELRPDSISVQLLANGKAYGDQVTLNSENGWSYEWTDLPVKLGKKTAVYTVEEIGTVTGYTTAYSADTFTITNTHDPKVYVEGKKTWNDNDNQDGLRPTSITINLLADGEQIDSMVVTPAADGTWSWRFDNLPKFKNVNGTVTKIQYSIEEIKVEGYESRKDYTNDRFNLINTHKPETIDLSGTKTWNDSNNQDGKRPSSIRINLLADGVKVAEKTVTASDGWSYKFTGMPKYAKGKEIRYTVTEDIVDGYTTSYSADGLSVINNYTPERTGRSVVKIWNDSNNADQIRPASIQVQLMADGSAYGSAVTLSSSNNWSYTWTELPVKQNGKIIEYTVREITNASGYTTAITLNGTTFTIVNTHTVTTPPPSPSGDPSSSPSSTPSATPSGNPSTTPGITPTPSSATTSTPDPETGEVLGARRGGAVLGARRGLDQAVLGKRRRPSTGDSAAMIIWVITLFGAMGGAAVSIAGLRKKDNKK